MTIEEQPFKNLLELYTEVQRINRSLNTENAQLREAVSNALNTLSRPHTHDKILSSYNAVQMKKLLKKLHTVSQISKAV